MNRLSKGSFTDRGIDENAVSPIIGVILMVALTVLLAAIIGALAFGIGTPERVPLASVVVDSVELILTPAGLLRQEVTLIHRGGESFNVTYIRIITLVNDVPLTHQLDDFPRSTAQGYHSFSIIGVLRGVGGDTIWDAGDTGGFSIAKGNKELFAGDQVTVNIIHKPSGAIITSSSAVVVDRR